MADDIIMIPLNTQCMAFLYAVAAGGVLAFCFAFLESVNKVLKLSNGFITAKDILYCTAPTVLTFYLSMQFCSGMLRWYLFAGELIGFTVVKFTVGDAVVKVFYSILSVAYGVVSYAVLLITVPVKYILKIFFKVILHLIRNVCKNAKKVFIKCKLCLKNSNKTLYNSFIRIGMSKNSSRKEVRRLARRKKRGSGFLVKIITLSFVACAAVSFIHSQSEVASKRRELAAINESIELQQIENDEVRRILDGDNDLEYIERIAREKLGYAYPDEKIFIDRSGS